MAGHSRWSNIKHKKAASDAKRGKLWSKCARAVIVAAKTGGGDPASNLSLRYAIDDAKAANMPKATIENAIKKGTGELAADNYESVSYEGYGPGGVAILVDALTDNRNRTAPEMRTIFQKGGGSLGASGSVSYLFSPKGQITIAKTDADEETVMTLALDAGAEDVTDDGDAWLISTDPANYRPVKEAIEKAGLTPAVAELTMVPANTVQISGETARKVLALMESLEDQDDVQKVHANFDIPAEELAALGG